MARICLLADAYHWFELAQGSYGTLSGAAALLFGCLILPTGAILIVSAIRAGRKGSRSLRLSAMISVFGIAAWVALFVAAVTQPSTNDLIAAEDVETLPEVMSLEPDHSMSFSIDSAYPKDIIVSVDGRVRTSGAAVALQLIFDPTKGDVLAIRREDRSSPWMTLDQWRTQRRNGKDSHEERKR